MSKTFETVLPLPTTDNHTYGMRGRIRFMFKEAKDWKELAQNKAREVWKGKPVECPVSVTISVFLKRERDLHGGLKILCDSLEGIVYKNDKQITEMILHKEFDKENPRIAVRVDTL